MFLLFIKFILIIVIRILSKKGVWIKPNVEQWTEKQIK